jgi:tetratricopeptide (TPR) repeat protein
VKFLKSPLIAAPIICLVAGGYWLWPRDEPAVAPRPWIVEAAAALNRSAIASSPHGATSGAGGSSGAARQLVAEGQKLRVQRRFAEAQAVYERAVTADPMDADLWADLADSAASAAGNDLTKGRDAIMHALAIDPRHRKALWLRASLELQEQRYATAAATWRELLALVAQGSTDARVIAANIVEADALAGTAQNSDGQGS